MNVEGADQVADRRTPGRAPRPGQTRAMTLEPGDLIPTGTPAGVGRLAAGDTIEVEGSGVGILRNTVR